MEAVSCASASATSLLQLPELTEGFAVQLAAAQQYCLTTAGYAPLHEWAKRHTWQMHSPPGEHDLIITPGNNQTIEVRPFAPCWPNLAMTPHVSSPMACVQAPRTLAYA